MNGRVLGWLVGAGLWAAAWLMACAAPSPPPAAPPPERPLAETAPPRPATSEGAHVRSPTANEQAVVDQLARAAERIRGLRFSAPVDVRVQDARAMKRFVEAQIDDAELERARQRYVLLGVLDPDLAVRPLLLDLMEEQLVGYYDPEVRALAIRADVAESLGEPARAQDVLALRAVILHELVHALQDQHFDLKAALERQRTTDAQEAFDALVEGDATLAMIAYVAESAGATLDVLLSSPALLEPMLAGSAPGSAESQLDRAPAIIRESLLFPYRAGAAYAARLAREGGFAQLDEAHRAPPTATAEVMWAHRAPPHGPTLPDLEGLLPPGVELLEDEVLGAFELGLVLEELGGERAWAEDWAADRLWQLRRGDETGIVWALAFGSPRTARKAHAVFSQHPSHSATREGKRVLVQIGRPATDLEGVAERLGGL